MLMDLGSGIIVTKVACGVSQGINVGYGEGGCIYCGFDL